MEIDRAYFSAKSEWRRRDSVLITKVIQKDGSTSLTEVANQFYLDGSSGSDPALRYKGANVTAGEFGELDTDRRGEDGERL